MQDEIDSLLKSLILVRRPDGPNRTVVDQPNVDTQRHVHDRLISIASETALGKLQVIHALIAVLPEPFQGVVGTDHRWTIAVEVLGELKAAEAVDTLVENLHRTGEYGIVSSRFYQPVMDAITSIGEPAVPRLIIALSDDNYRIRLRAAMTLANIGEAALTRLERALEVGNAETKAGAVLALELIGGKRAGSAVERAIETETDPEALRRLKAARDKKCLDCK